MKPQITNASIDWITVDDDTNPTTVAADDYDADLHNPRGAPIERVHGYGARLSMPGYLDCTEWTIAPTIGHAASELVEMWADTDDPDECPIIAYATQAVIDHARYSSQDFSAGQDRGSFGSAYVSEDPDVAWATARAEHDGMSETIDPSTDMGAGFVVGCFASLEIYEVPAHERERYDAAVARAWDIAKRTEGSDR